MNTKDMRELKHRRKELDRTRFATSHCYAKTAVTGITHSSAMLH